MNKVDRSRIADMLHYAELAVGFVGQADPVALAADERTFLATCMAIQIVGEAANHVSPALRKELRDVPWRDAVDMRNRLIHGYRSIVSEIVVGTVRNDLPPFIALLRRVLDESNP